MVNDLALLQNVGAIGYFQRPLDVLLNQQNRRALLLHARKQLKHFIDQERHDALRRLVHQDHAGLGHHRPCDGQHLLLAPRQRCAVLLQTLFKPGKSLCDLIHHRIHLATPGAGQQAQLKVLQYRQPGHNTALFRDVSQAKMVARMRWLTQQFLPVKSHVARALAQQAHDGSKCAGFARAIAPHQRHNLAAFDLEA